MCTMHSLGIVPIKILHEGMTMTNPLVMHTGIGYPVSRAYAKCRAQVRRSRGLCR